MNDTLKLLSASERRLLSIINPIAVAKGKYFDVTLKEIKSQFPSVGLERLRDLFLSIIEKCPRPGIITDMHFEGATVYLRFSDNYMKYVEETAPARPARALVSVTKEDLQKMLDGIPSGVQIYIMTSVHDVGLALAATATPMDDKDPSEVVFSIDGAVCTDPSTGNCYLMATHFEVEI